MNDDNRLEESRLDADHIDRLTRQLHSQHMLMQKIMLDSAAAFDVMESRAEAAESALAEAAEDYANLASTTNDLLRIAQARAEKAEADLETYKAREIAVNPWGVALCEKLGDFLQQTADATTPLTTQINIVFPEGSLPAIHLWATVDDQEPAARCADLRDRLNDAVQRAEKAEAALATANDGLYVTIKQSKGTT